MAAAGWSPSTTVSESGTRYGFGQDVGPDGTGMVVWSAPLTGGNGYLINAREVGVEGQLGTKVAVSEVTPGMAYTSAYAPTVHYDGAGTATIVWLESTYNSNSCFAESGESSEECVVDEYVRARQIDAGGSLSPVRVLQHRQTVLPGDGSFGGTSSAYVTYGQPVIAGGPASTLTVLWPESSFDGGCAAYGSSRSYADTGCESDQRIEWVRLSGTAVPQGTAAAAFESHTSGYGSGEPLLRLRAGTAADGTVTVLFDARRSASEAKCWGGESSVAFFRIAPGGSSGASQELDSGCGVAEPDLAVDPGGAAVAVWGWGGTYSGDEALFARIDSAGSASPPQTLLDGDEGARVSGLDVSRGVSGSALAVWAAEGSIRSRRLFFTGPPGPTAVVVTPPAGRYLSAPRLAAGPDGAALLIWESTLEDRLETSLQAAALDADGTLHSPRTLLAPNRWDHGARVSAGPSGSFLASWRISVPQRNRIQAARFGTEPADGNDAFSAAQPLEAELPSFASGSNIGAGKEPGEPDHAGGSGGASVWYSWTAGESDPVTLATCASDGLNPALAVYTGGSLAGLTPVASARGGAPNPCSTGDAGVRFDAVAGTTYRIAIDGEGGSQGSFGLKLVSRQDAPANDAFAAAAQVTGGLPRYLSGWNTDAGREPGEPEHAGNPGGASVWFSWTAPAGGNTKITACGSGLPELLLAVYTGSALSSLTEVGSGAGSCGSVPFKAVAGTTYRIAVDGKDGREGSFQLRFVQAPANDDLAKAQTLSGPSPFVSGFNVGASKEPGEPDHAGDPGGASVWYSWTPSISGTIFVSACMPGGKAKSPLLAVYTGSDAGHLTEVAADIGGTSSSGCFSRYSEVSFSFQAGTRYLVAVDGPGGLESSFNLSFEAGPTNDDFAAAQPIVGSLPQSIYGSSRHATKEPGEPNHAGQAGGASVWYSWTPSESGIAVLSACGQFGGEPPLLAVYRGASLATLTEVAAGAGGGISCFGGSSKAEFAATAGQNYRIALDDSAGAGLGSLRLEVGLEQVPANDEFAAAKDLSGGDWSYGSNRHATKEPGEPNHAGQAGGASVWFRWTPAQDGLYAFSTCSYGGLDPLLAVYTGSTLAGIEPVVGDDDGGNCSDKDAEVRFNAVAGTTYRIAVDGKAASTGYFELKIATRPENDDLAAATDLSGAAPLFVSDSNWLATKEPGEPAHAGDPGGTSVWYSWTPSGSSIVQLAVCSYGALDPLLALYTGSSPAALAPVAGEDKGKDPECSGRSTRLRLNAQAGTTYRIAVDGRPGSYGEFTLALRTTPDNDDFADANPLSAELPLSSYGDSRVATAQPGEPPHAGVAAAASVWYSWTPTVSGPVRLSTCSYGAIDPLLTVYTGSSLATLGEVAAADDSPGSGCSEDDAGVSFDAVAGTTYRIAVDAKDGNGGFFELRMRAAGPANDDFSGAIAIAPSPGLYTGTTVGAGAQANEPGSPHQSVWYRMQADQNGTVRLHTCSDAGEPMDLDVYTGSSPTTLSQVALQQAGTAFACSAPPGTIYSDTPTLAFDAVAGTVYWISVDRYQQISPVYELRPSAPFTLVVDAPADDLQAAAERIPYNGAHLVRTNVGATHEAGEADHAGDPGGSSIWFRWFASATGPAQIDTCGSEIDTLLAVYGEGEVVEPEDEDSAVEEYGEEPTSLPPPTPGSGLTANDDSDLCGKGSAQSGLELTAEEGTEYLIAVDGKLGETGQIHLGLAFETPDTTSPDTYAYIPPATNTHQLTVSLSRDEPESSFECALDGGPFLPCDLGGSELFPYATVSGLEEGTHTLAVREVDAAGNPDPTPESGEFKVDMVPPQTEITSGPKGLTKELGPYTFESDEPGSFECWINELSPLHCSSPYFTPNSLPDGDYVLHVRARDLAGNVDQTSESRSFHLDRTPPVATVDVGPKGTVEADSVIFEFSVNEPSSFRCQLDERPVDDCESPRAYAGLADGDHVFKLIATDVAGNQTKAVTAGFKVENRPPQTKIVEGPSGPQASSSAVFEFSADEPVSGFECSVDEAPFSACENPAELSDLDEGEHQLLARAVDTAGKQDPTPAAWNWTVDTTAPETTIAGGPSGTTNKRGPFSFSADEPVSGFECSVDEAKFNACTSGYLLPFNLADGEHTLRVRAVDRAGNVDPTPAERTLTLDTSGPGVEIVTPPPAVSGPDVLVEFELDEDATDAECRIDVQAFQPCASPIEFKGMPDGPHSVSVRGVDAVGNRGPAASAAFTVDVAPPETEIAPRQRDYFGPGPVEIDFKGSADTVEYECSLDAAPFAGCLSPVVYEDLAEGPHEMQVRAIDGAGNLDATPAALSFTVDTTAPETTITAGPSGPVHTQTLPFEYESSESPQAFQCALDESEWRPCAAVLAEHQAGDHLFAVRAEDRAGNVDPTPATQALTVVNQDPVPTLALDRVSGPAPLAVNADVEVADPDGDTLASSLQWGDGAVSVGGVPSTGLTHTFTEPGVYLVRVDLNDGFGTAAATQVVTVTAPEPVHADAGDDLTAVAGEPVVLDGSDSRPLAGVNYRWSLSGGGSSESRFSHTFDEPGNYEAELTVEGLGGKDNDVALVHVVPPSGGVAKVLTRHGGTPLQGVQVLAALPDDRRVEAVSGNDGIARLRGLPAGSFKVYAQKEGYVPSVGDVEVDVGGAGSGEVALEPGDAGAITVTSHRMTLQEIEAAGIDTSDPSNLHVYEFTFGGNFTACVTSAGFFDCGGGGGGGSGAGGCTPLACHTGRTTIIRKWDERANAPILAAITLPARATFLKEFFDITVTVHNLAAPGITFANGHAAIKVPSGMSLAPTPTPQQFTYDVPDVPGHSSRTLHWILRGDVEGSYPIGVSYAASLEPFGSAIRLEGKTDEPVKVWGGSALQLKVDVDNEARDRFPFTTFVRLENVADVPVYNVGLSLPAEGQSGFVEQPRQGHDFALRELPVGQTYSAGPVVLVPGSSGEIDLSRSFIRKVAGDVDIGGTVVRHPRRPSFQENPRIEAKNLGNQQINLDWDPVPGADRYEVYEVPDRRTPFAEEPVHYDPDGESGGIVAAAPEGEEAYYAVSTIIDGRHLMVHPLIKAPPPPLPGGGEEDALGAPKGECGHHRIPLGPAEILASCFYDKGNNVFEAKGRVRVNGVDLFPQDARIFVDVQHQRLTVSNARLQIGNIVLYQGRIDWTLGATIRLGIPAGTTVRGMPVSGNLRIDLKPDSAKLEAAAKMPSILGGGSGSLKLAATNADGPKVNLFEIKADGLSLNGRLGIDGVLLNYQRTSAGDRWEGGATIAIPRPLSPLRVQGRLALLNGKFASASAQVDGINQHLAYGVFLQRLRAGIAVNPLSLSGGIGLSAGPQILGREAISIDGDGSATFGNPQVYDVRGKIIVVNEAEIASGHLTYRSSGQVEFGGSLGIDKSGFKAKVSADGWVDGTRAFNAHGGGSFSIPGVSFSAEGVVSNVGIAACRHGSGPDVGAGYHWGGDVTFFASSCDIGEFEAVHTFAVPGGAQRFNVVPGEPVEVLAFSGEDAAPRVVLREPDGTEIATPADGSGIDKPQLMLAQNERDDTTYVAIYSPAGGSWTLDTAPGSALVVGVRRAGALPSPQVAATVEPAGGEAVLRWQLRPIPGQRVELVERTEHGAQVIATTNSATGAATFTPLADDGASPRIVAVVEQYGLPRTVTPVEHYLAPDTATAPAGSSATTMPAATETPPQARPVSRPHAPDWVRLQRRAGRVVVSWSAVHGVRGYMLRARLSGGRQVQAERRNGRLVIAGVGAEEGVSVSVWAIGDDGRRGPARQARLGVAR